MKAIISVILLSSLLLAGAQLTETKASTNLQYTSASFSTQ